MADTGIFATTAEVQRKVGANASTTANVEAYINQFMTEAESFINATTQFNWSDKYSALNVDVKGILKECAGNMAALMVINYDTVNIGRAEADTRINVLFDRIQKCLRLLEDKELKKFMEAA